MSAAILSEEEYARLTWREFLEYQDSLKVMRDNQNVIDAAREEGERRKTLDMARHLIARGVSVDIMKECCCITDEDVEALKKEE